MKTYTQFITEIQNLREAGRGDYWFDTKKKKRIFLSSGTHHINQVVKMPKRFGLTKEKIIDLVGTKQAYQNIVDNISTWNPFLLEYLFSKGWVRVVGDTSDPSFDGKNLKLIRQALEDYMKNVVRVPVETVTYDETSKKESGFIAGETNIEFFLKTGRINKSKLAAFR